MIFWSQTGQLFSGALEHAQGYYRIDEAEFGVGEFGAGEAGSGEAARAAADGVAGRWSGRQMEWQADGVAGGVARSVVGGRASDARDHRARVVWRSVGSLDLNPLYAKI